MSVVYLLHFERRLHHAGHYLGTAADLEARLEQHRSGRPHHARLMEVIHARGIRFTLARTWHGGRALERRLKRGHCGPRLCPLCTARPLNLTPSGRSRSPASHAGGADG